MILVWFTTVWPLCAHWEKTNQTELLISLGTSELTCALRLENPFSLPFHQWFVLSTGRSDVPLRKKRRPGLQRFSRSLRGWRKHQSLREELIPRSKTPANATQSLSLNDWIPRCWVITSKVSDRIWQNGRDKTSSLRTTLSIPILCTIRIYRWDWLQLWRQCFLR